MRIQLRRRQPLLMDGTANLARAFPVERHRPLAISYSTAPNENRSLHASSSLAFTCSGDMYATVPSIAPGLIRCCGSGLGIAVKESALALPLNFAFASPKSRILACPRSVTKMLAGLMSRSPRPCRARHPAHPFWVQCSQFRSQFSLAARD